MHKREGLDKHGIPRLLPGHLRESVRAGTVPLDALESVRVPTAGPALLLNRGLHSQRWVRLPFLGRQRPGRGGDAAAVASTGVTFGARWEVLPEVWAAGRGASVHVAWVLVRGPPALRVEQREEPAGLQAGPGLWRAADLLTFHQRR